MKKAIIVLKVILTFAIIFFFTMPFGWYISNDIKLEIESVQSTITNTRDKGFEVELTGVTQQVIEYNKELFKYQNIARVKLFKYHFVKNFNDIEPIR